MNKKMSKIRAKIYITIIKTIKIIILTTKKMTKSEFSKQCNFNKNNNKHKISKCQNVSKTLISDTF